MNRPVNPTIRELVREITEAVTDLDFKFLHTLQSLVFRPGFLGQEYLQGRRIRYVSPVRLYLIVSFLFFLLLSLQSGGNRFAPGGKPKKLVSFSITVSRIQSTELRNLNEAQIDSLMIARQVPQTRFYRFAIHQMDRIAKSDNTEFGHLILRTVSYFMFLLMPVFGFLLSIFYFRLKKNYFEFLIHSLHVHSFLFLVLSLVLLTRWVVPSFWIFVSSLVVCVVYLILLEKRAFNHTGLRAALKTIPLIVLYLVLVLVVFILTILISMLLF